MIPTSRTPIWSPITSVDDLDLRRVTRDGVDWVEIIDKRTWVELVSVPAGEAMLLSIKLVAAAGEAAYSAGET